MPKAAYTPYPSNDQDEVGFHCIVGGKGPARLVPVRTVGGGKGGDTYDLLVRLVRVTVYEAVDGWPECPYLGIARLRERGALGLKGVGQDTPFHAQRLYPHVREDGRGNIIELRRLRGGHASLDPRSGEQ